MSFILVNMLSIDYEVYIASRHLHNLTQQQNYQVNKNNTQNSVY